MKGFHSEPSRTKHPFAAPEPPPPTPTVPVRQPARHVLLLPEEFGVEVVPVGSVALALPIPLVEAEKPKQAQWIWGLVASATKNHQLPPRRSSQPRLVQVPARFSHVGHQLEWAGCL